MQWTENEPLEILTCKPFFFARFTDYIGIFSLFTGSSYGRVELISHEITLSDQGLFILQEHAIFLLPKADWWQLGELTSKLIAWHAESFLDRQVKTLSSKPSGVLVVTSKGISFVRGGTISRRDKAADLRDSHAISGYWLHELVNYNLEGDFFADHTIDDEQVIIYVFYQENLAYFQPHSFRSNDTEIDLIDRLQPFEPCYALTQPCELSPVQAQLSEENYFFATKNFILALDIDENSLTAYTPEENLVPVPIPNDQSFASVRIGVSCFTDRFILAQYYLPRQLTLYEYNTNTTEYDILAIANSNEPIRYLIMLPSGQALAASSRLLYLIENIDTELTLTQLGESLDGSSYYSSFIGPIGDWAYLVISSSEALYIVKISITNLIEEPTLAYTFIPDPDSSAVTNIQFSSSGLGLIVTGYKENLIMHLAQDELTGNLSLAGKLTKETASGYTFNWFDGYFEEDSWKEAWDDWSITCKSTPMSGYISVYYGWYLYGYVWKIITANQAGFNSLTPIQPQQDPNTSIIRNYGKTLAMVKRGHQLDIFSSRFLSYETNPNSLETGRVYFFSFLQEKEISALVSYNKYILLASNEGLIILPGAREQGKWALSSISYGLSERWSEPALQNSTSTDSARGAELLGRVGIYKTKPIVKLAISGDTFYLHFTDGTSLLLEGEDIFENLT